tara:strand:- start:680 stop:1012 length:333 start_codon:yes stop_codon:yes gene_type:complete
MMARILFFSFIILEFFGCAGTRVFSKKEIPNRCYESDYMEENSFCLDREISTLEGDLTDRERSIYEMAKRKINDKYHQLYFLRLSPRERKEYLSYMYNGEPPVYYRNSFF